MPISEVRKEHVSLVMKLQQTFKDSKKFEDLKLVAKSFLPSGVIGQCTEMKDLVKELEGYSIIKIGDYSQLKFMIDKAGCNDDEILTTIEEAEAAIRKAELEVSPNAKPYSHQDTPNKLANTEFEATIAGASNYSAAETVQRTDKIKQSPGTLVKEEYKKGRGFCLFINIFVKDRPGPKKDAKGLKDFLESVGCVVETMEDPSLEKINDQLNECQQLLKNKMSNYSYFICVILSHWDKEGICTFDDRHIKIKDVMAKFKNDKIPAFVDRCFQFPA